jgi:hypothetical protein
MNVNLPDNWRDLEASWPEWDALPKDQQLAIIREFGYRRRPGEAAPASAQPASSPAPSTAATAAHVIQPQRCSEAEGKAAIEYCLQRRRELGLTAEDPTAAPRVAADLDQDIVTQWHADAEIRAEFGELARYAAFRRACASGTLRCYDDGSASTDAAVQSAIDQGAEEDRLAGVDPRLPVEKRAEQAWRLNTALQKEFGGSFEAYLALRRRAERSAQG